MIQIVVDSGCDMTPEEAADLGITLMPLTVCFGEETYKSGYEISNEEFFKRLAECKEIPTTSQVNPYDFEQKYRELLANGDEVLSIHMSSKMSGTYQSAVIASNAIGSDKLVVVDTMNVSGAYALLVHEALRMRDNGSSLTDIAAAINEMVPRLRLHLILNTLEYLKKGGRISASVAFIGDFLGLHPVVGVVDGEATVLDKVKGRKSSNKWLVERIKSMKTKTDTPIVLSHSNAPEKATKLKELLEENGFTNIIATYNMSPIVGTYGGADSVGMHFVETN